MAEDTRPDTTTPWYLRVKTLVITAGALAAALVSVIALWNVLRNPDVNDEAVITDVRVVKPMMLVQFDSGQLGENLPLQADPDAAGGGPVMFSLLGNLATTATPAPSPQTSTTTSTPTPTVEPTETTTPTVEPTKTTTPTVGPTNTSTPAPPIQTFRDTLAQAMASDPRIAVSGLQPTDVIATLPDVAYSFSPNAGAPEDPGPTYTPQQVIDELLETLKDVEGDPGSLDRRGWLVTVALDVAGYQGEQLKLTYSLDPTVEGDEGKIPDSWSAPHLCYYLTPSTQQDTGVVDIWIPDLEGTAPYVVNIELRAVEDNLKIASGQSPPVEDQ